MKHLAALILLTLCGSGCVADMITRRMNETDQRKAYLEYRSRTEQLNLEREKASLTPVHVMEWNEWQSAPATTTQTKSVRSPSGKQ